MSWYDDLNTFSGLQPRLAKERPARTFIQDTLGGWRGAAIPGMPARQ